MPSSGGCSGRRRGARRRPGLRRAATGRPVYRSQLTGRYRKALEAAGIDTAFRFHDLRHTFGTSMAAAGEPVTTTQAWMGHALLSTTQRYMHDAPATAEASRIGAAFAAADPRAGGPSGTELAEPARVEVSPDVANGTEA